MPKTNGKIRRYSLKELSKRLDVNIVTLRAYISTGRLKGAKMGVQWMVSEDNLREYFNKNSSLWKKKHKS
jgi:predicted site-specific integrase-resolvase